MTEQPAPTTDETPATEASDASASGDPSQTATAVNQGAPVTAGGPGARPAVDETVTDADLAALAEQLGREPRGVVGIAARCACGRPLVVRTAPRLENGTPFPTTFYLTHPALVSGASTLEANGVMKEMTDRLGEDAELTAAYRRAHEHYLAEREALGHVEEIDGISAGGMPTRVKCLHVLVGHALAAGPGVQPLGDEALARIVAAGTWSWDRCRC